MLSLELFAGLLSKFPANCSLVLVGDPNQLSSVGTGNLIPKLLELGCPVTRLERQYRQSDNESALFYNVVNYPKLSDSEELKFDDSFQLIPASEGDIFKVIQEEAVKRYPSDHGPWHELQYCPRRDGGSSGPDSHYALAY